MSESIEKQIIDLRQKVEKAKAEKARREAMVDNARSIHKTTLDSLRELGHDSPESALEEANKLRDGLTETVADIEKKLAEASA